MDRGLEQATKTRKIWCVGQETVVHTTNIFEPLPLYPAQLRTAHVRKTHMRVKHLTLFLLLGQVGSLGEKSKSAMFIFTHANYRRSKVQRLKSIQCISNLRAAFSKLDFSHQHKRGRLEETRKLRAKRELVCLSVLSWRLINCFCFVVVVVNEFLFSVCSVSGHVFALI